MQSFFMTSFWHTWMYKCGSLIYLFRLVDVLCSAGFIEGMQYALGTTTKCTQIIDLDHLRLESTSLKSYIAMEN